MKFQIISLVASLLFITHVAAIPQGVAERATTASVSAAAAAQTCVLHCEFLDFKISLEFNEHSC